MPTTSMSQAAVQATGLRKTFRVKAATGEGSAASPEGSAGAGKRKRPGSTEIEALAGVDLAVATGQIFGFLGPNGAGKTTMLRILTTLMPADAGEAFVAGADVRRRPKDVRRRIGYVGQAGGADLSATGVENLLLQGRLYGMSAAATTRRADELIEALDLGVFAGRVARSYSGGQRRRLDLALGVMHRPQVVFLDEPTTGLDPQNRANLWDQLRSLREGGNTIFLTTHYLEEADQLSDRLAIMDHGRIIAEGTSGELKRRYSGGVLSITPDLPRDHIQDLERDLAGDPSVREARAEGSTIRLTVTDATGALAAVSGRLRASGIRLRSAALAEPSLDDVFLSETGRSLRDAGPPGAGGEGGAALAAGEKVPA